MEFRHLRSFLILAEEAHFGRAADRLGISQPPLSRQIQQLEAELGVRLFVRNSRSVKLTQEGQTYLDQIRPHLEGLERAADAVRTSKRNLVGRVRVGFVSNLAHGLIPRVLKSLGKAYPDIAVELSELASSEQLRGIRERRLDIGLVILPVEDPGLKMRKLFSEALVAMIPADHPLASCSPLPVSALSGLPMVLCTRFRQSGFHEVVLDFCRSAGFEPRVTHETSSSGSMAELIAAGLGVALVPESASLHPHPGIVYRRLADAPLILDVAAVWIEESMSPPLRAFLDQAIGVSRDPEFRLGSAGVAMKA